ncbi:CRISPR-associated Cse2 family protein [Rhodothalassium salexigens DSM 2132]|uniref:CRISPR-associated Cse2 family protein n=1 Tax=Rhodothalassium salexigens DSM 2132 TaxID=1188247 RepID=A0A4R2PLY3_RHOSA|nr:type I-E CRISPR-associated protein Cse2/CasB [Rhodothalassium salexigens]MBB4210855.1 CRISPR system Cascade subunit CasB [Rhodothalassium salexigens DSM 2132]MBK1639144.1 type I-E CRISPR-associated protein Cse2/CasB [Rhodothalassium salexigens DSM 2132]TCP36487.1 CRISPR-associated Cse2 family protein [Rhodothalassium salexigens DSM 2132]
MNDRKPDPGIVARDWWRDLQTDRAAMANLRRCHDPTEALFLPATLRLWRALPLSRHQLERAGTLAVTLAHVRKDAHEDAPNRSIAQAIGPGSLDTKHQHEPRLSQARFRRLLLTDGQDEAALMTAMVRLVRMLRGTVNVPDLAVSIVWWTDRTRQRWAFDYFNAGSARPGAGATDTEDTSPALVAGDAP